MVLCTQNTRGFAWRLIAAWVHFAQPLHSKPPWWLKYSSGEVFSGAGALACLQIPSSVPCFDVSISGFGVNHVRSGFAIKFC